MPALNQSAIFYISMIILRIATPYFPVYSALILLPSKTLVGLIMQNNFIANILEGKSRFSTVNNGLFMPPTLEKLKGHIAFGLSVRPYKLEDL